MNQDETQKQAEQIAAILRGGNLSEDISALRSGIAKIADRLDAIEQTLETSPKFQSASLGINPQNIHPSREKFQNLEILADEIINSTEKACPYEPTGKPCDNCAMCNSRGF